MVGSRSLRTVVRQGDIRASLEALRDKLAAEVDAAEGRDVAPLAKQLADVMERLESLPRKEGSRVDELARRRSERLPGAAVSELSER